MSLFKKSNKSKRAKMWNREAVSQLKALIHKIETGQMTVKSYGGWPGVGTEYNFHIVTSSAEIEVLAEELEKK